ncbi:MAG TPA: glycosyltransferase family 39 protein [Verrucomicrobiae bacterium]|jgi:hypothetical protein|nr:glycosyltransferase family 39 protein [Verrucomicrobiae bacterium]
MNPFQKKLTILVVLAGVLLPQTLAIRRPLAGHFGSYQQVMAGMARGFERGHFKNLLLPETDIIVGGERSLHLNQYPFPSLFAAFGDRFLGLGLEFWGRLQAILFNLASIVLIGLIAGALFDRAAGWMTAAIYAFSPYALINGQLFFSEPMAMACLLLAVYLLVRSEEIGMAEIVGSALALGLAITGRIHLVLFYPLLAWQSLRRSRQPVSGFLVYSVFAAALPLAWYGFTYFASLNSEHILTNIFFQAAARKVGDQNYLRSLEYYRHIFDILAQTMLTPLVFPFLFAGLAALYLKKHKAAPFLLGGLAAGGAIAVLSPQKVMAHDFYLYGLFPFVCLCAGWGLRTTAGAFPAAAASRAAFAGLALYFLVSARYFAHPIFTVPPETADDLAAARAVRSLTQPDDKIIVGGDSPATLLYYADRPAWTMQFTEFGKGLPYYLNNPKFSKRSAQIIQEEEEAMKDPVTWLEYLKGQGAHYFAVPRRAELDKETPLAGYLKGHYAELSKPKDPFYLFDLHGMPEEAEMSPAV